MYLSDISLIMYASAVQILWHLNNVFMVAFFNDDMQWSIQIFCLVLLWNRSKWLIANWSAFLPNRNASCRRKRKESRNGSRKVRGWVLLHELNCDGSCLHLSNKLAVLQHHDCPNNLLTLWPNVLLLQFILLLIMYVQSHVMYLYHAHADMSCVLANCTATHNAVIYLSIWWYQSVLWLNDTSYSRSVRTNE